MSIEAMTAVLNHSKAKGTAKLVLLGIANHDGEGGAWVGVAKLATYAGVDERNVQRAVAKLVGSGELRVHYNDGGTHRTPDHARPNRYDVLVSCPGWCDRTTQHRDTRKLSGRQLHLSTALSTAVDRPPGASATPSPAPPGASATAPPGASATRTVHGTPPPPVVSQPQNAREAADRRPCSSCGLGEWQCQRQQLAWTEADRHDYDPLPVRHASR